MPAETINAGIPTRRRLAPQNWLPWQRSLTEVQRVFSRSSNSFIGGGRIFTYDCYLKILSELLWAFTPTGWGKNPLFGTDFER